MERKSKVRHTQEGKRVAVCQLRKRLEENKPSKTSVSDFQPSEL